MQAINKNKSIKLKLSVAGAALCASFLLTTNSNQAVVKADTITGKQVQVNSNNASFEQNKQDTQENATKHPDIPVQVVGNEDASETSQVNQAEQAESSASTSKQTNVPVNPATQVPTVSTPTKDKVSKTNTSLQGKTISTSDNSWDTVQTDYDDVNHALTIKGGTLTNPNPIYKQFADKANDLQTIKITDKVSLSGSAKGLFSNLTNLKTIEGLENVDVTNVTDMSYLFNGNTNLTRLDLSYWAPKNTTDMNHMFSNCTNLERVYIKDNKNDSTGNVFDVSNVTNMSAMFQGDKSLIYFGDHASSNSVEATENDIKNGMYVANLVYLTTDKVTDMSYMFQGCSSLIKIDFGVNTNSLKTFSHFAADCDHLMVFTEESVDDCTTSNVADWSYMFANDPELNEVQATFAVDEDKYIDSTATHMFYNDSKLGEVLFSGYGYLTDTSYMFVGCSAKEPIDIGSFTSAAAGSDRSEHYRKLTNMAHMYENCSGMSTINLSDFVINDKVDSTDMLKGTNNLHELMLSKNVNLEHTGFHAPFDYVGFTSNDAASRGKKFSSTQLRKFWNNQTSDGYFEGTPVPYYNVTVNFIDTKNSKVLKTFTAQGNQEDPLEFKNDFDNAIKELTQDGNYTYDAKNNKVPLDKNGDIQLPASVKSDVAYTVGLTPKAAPVVPTPTPTPHVDTPTTTIITNVVVHYQDEFGNKLQADTTITGKLGGSWNAVPAEIKGYHLVDTKGMATGTISDVRQEVTFVYAKDQPAKPAVPNKPTNKPAKPQHKPAKPSKKPSKSNKPNKQPKPAVIDHGTVYLPSTNKIASGNSKMSISRPTIVKATYADSTAKSLSKDNANGNLPQTGTNVQDSSSTLIAGLTALLISVLSYLGIAFKKKEN